MLHCGADKLFFKSALPTPLHRQGAEAHHQTSTADWKYRQWVLIRDWTELVYLACPITMGTNCDSMVVVQVHIVPYQFLKAAVVTHYQQLQGPVLRIATPFYYFLTTILDMGQIRSTCSLAHPEHWLTNPLLGFGVWGGVVGRYENIFCSWHDKFRVGYVGQFLFKLYMCWYILGMWQVISFCERLPSHFVNG